MAKTSTTRFGVSRREGHDASAFYDRQLAPADFSTDDTVNPLPARTRNRIFEHSSEVMHELPDNSVALAVTSPPYHVGKDYDSDCSYREFIDMLATILAETHRVLEPGGRAAINVANLGRRPYVPLSHHVTSIMTDLGFHMRAEIIWQKAAGANGSCAWGTFQSAKNPVLRDLHEYVLVFSKGRMDRAYKGESTITKEAFMRDTLSIWNIAPESATNVGHPAPFPVELPKRLIELYTYVDDVVLDPFMGAGATAVASIDTRRQFIGYDTDRSYTRTARRRIREARTAAKHAPL